MTAIRVKALLAGLLLVALGGCLDEGETTRLSPRPCELADDQGNRLPCSPVTFDATWLADVSWPDYECAVRDNGRNYSYDLLKPGRVAEGGPFLLRITDGIPKQGLGVLVVGTPKEWIQVNMTAADAGKFLVIPERLGPTIGWAFQWFVWEWEDDVDEDLDLIPTSRPTEVVDQGSPAWNNWLVLKAGDDHALANHGVHTPIGIVVSEAPAVMRVNGTEHRALVGDVFEVAYSGRITVDERSDDACTRDYMPPLPSMVGATLA